MWIAMSSHVYDWPYENKNSHWNYQRCMMLQEGLHFKRHMYRFHHYKLIVGHMYEHWTTQKCELKWVHMCMIDHMETKSVIGITKNVWCLHFCFWRAYEKFPIFYAILLGEFFVYNFKILNILIMCFWKYS